MSDAGPAECPIYAIYELDDKYVIFYNRPQCVILCPERAIVPDLEHRESKEELIGKGRRLLAVL